MSNEINPTFGQLTKIYNLFAIWGDKEESETRRRGWKLFYNITFVMFYILILLVAFITYNKDKSLYVSQVAIGAVGVYMKVIYLLYNKDSVLSSLRENVFDCSILDSAEKEQVGKKTGLFMKLANAYIVMLTIASTVAVISTLPIFTVDTKLPLYVSFSLDWKYNEIVYWMAYILLTWGIALCVIFSSIIIIVWYILLKLSLQYKILGNQFRNLGANTIRTTGKQNVFLQDLIGLVKTHRNLVDTTDRFRLCFHNFFLTQMIISGIYICTSTYVLAFSSFNNLFESAMNIVSIVYGVVNIFLVMYFANEITLYSDRLSYCLFESNWIEQSPSYKKCFIILSEVLKQPQELVICKLYPMNLQTFTSILNSAYSMFNILKSFK